MRGGSTDGWSLLHENLVNTSGKESYCICTELQSLMLDVLLIIMIIIACTIKVTVH